MHKKTIQLVVAVAVLCLAVAGLIALIVMITSKQVTTFQECAAVGGVIRETYPEQCVFRDRTFVNTHSTENIDYVGMTEQEALDQAKTIHVPARVVERDGESLPVTMDYVVGRLNLSVRGGLVYKVDIEGE